MASENQYRNPYDLSSDFWQKYLKGRPRVPDNFFERIFAYHAEHGGSFGTVHDAGAGVGVHSARLGKKFDHVLVTDVSQQNIDVARERFKGADAERYEFKVSKLEQTIDLPPASMDMVFCGVMLHFTDLDEALAAVAHQLKPGGTFVAGGWGMWVLEDETARAAWLRFWHEGLSQYLTRAWSDERLKGAWTIGDSAYDAVPVPEKYFQPGALRVRLNWIGDRAWYEQNVPVDFRDRLPIESHLGTHDVLRTESEEGWHETMDINRLREVVDTFPNMDLDNEKVRPLWEDFVALVGDRKMKGHWPATLILATRNE